MPAAASAAAAALPDADAEPGHSGHQQGLAPGCAEVRGWEEQAWEQEHLGPTLYVCFPTPVAP